jgi:hypothetical protein
MGIIHKSGCHCQMASSLMRVYVIVDMTAGRRGGALPDPGAGTAGHALGSRRAEASVNDGILRSQCQLNVTGGR